MVIAGHTDSTGNAALNQRLSERRASAVLQYLRKHGLPAAIPVQVSGHGQRQPIADNLQREGRRLNRRVEFAADAGCTPQERQEYVRKGREAEQCYREQEERVKQLRPAAPGK
jgi:hypothetical protein